MKNVLRTSCAGLSVILALAMSFYSCAVASQSPINLSPKNIPPIEQVPVYGFNVVNVYPHDRDAFTQGLVFDGGFIFESTGLYGRSTVRRIELATGDILQLRKLPDELFGEGITIYESKIIQLTWQSGRGFVYDRNNFELLQEFSYPTEGWGITNDGARLIMSDGTSILRFIDPDTFSETGHIEIKDGENPVTRLNELEYVRGEIFANVWKTDRIAIISPVTGKVRGWIDLEGLLPPEEYEQPVDVLNGIAYDPQSNRLFVTGKLWPRLYEIEIIASK